MQQATFPMLAAGTAASEIQNASLHISVIDVVHWCRYNLRDSTAWLMSWHLSSAKAPMGRLIILGLVDGVIPHQNISIPILIRVPNF